MGKIKLDSIQMFRGIAALMVVFFHFRVVLPLHSNDVIGDIIIKGYSGVDIFFVISGFIAYYTVQTSDYSGNSQGVYYFFKRIAKIIPLYYIFTFLSAGHSLESMYQTLKSLAFIPLGLGREGPIYGGTRISQGWTLNYEMYFYIIVSISFIFGQFKWWFTCLIMLLLVIIPPYFIEITDNYLWQGFNFNMQYLSMITNPINLEFLIGVIVGYLHSKMNDKTNVIWYILIGLSLMLFGINYHQPFILFSRATAWSFPAALLILAFLKLEKANQLPASRMLVTIGNRSFSIYLIHAGVINVITKIANHSFHQHGQEYPVELGVFLFVLALTITWFLSGLTHKYFEKKMSSKFRGWLLSLSIFRGNPPPTSLLH